MKLYGLPQALTGNELVTVRQTQPNGLATCSLPLSELIALAVASLGSLPTTLPATHGIPWNNAGVVSIS